MDNISSTTKVHVWFLHPSDGRRVWVVAVQNEFDKKLNRLVLRPNMDDDSAKAQPFTYEFAVRMRSRFLEDLGPLYAAHFSLGDDPTGPEVGVSANSSSGDDNRVPMIYRGLVVTPGFDVKLGRVWFVKFPGNIARESLRGSTVEEVVDRAYELGMQASAEQAPLPEPVKEEVKVPAGPRQRPGDRWN